MVVSKSWRLHNIKNSLIAPLLIAFSLVWGCDAFAKDPDVRCVPDIYRKLFADPGRKPAPFYTLDHYSPENVELRSHSARDFYSPPPAPSRAVKLSVRTEIQVSRHPLSESSILHLERYVSEEEAISIFRTHALQPKEGHLNSAKWVGLKGKVDPRTLGSRSNYQYKIEIDVDKNAKPWLSQFETKKDNEPGRFEIPPSGLADFNSHIVHLNVIKRN